MSKEAKWVIGAWAVVFLILLAIVWFGGGIIIVRSAGAHDHWISNSRLTDPASGEWCCNHIDCQAEKVSEVTGGYLTQAGDVVPYSRIIWKSRDGSWWRCRNMKTNATRCLIGPPPGS